jgi:hypothetical protein
VETGCLFDRSDWRIIWRHFCLALRRLIFGVALLQREVGQTRQGAGHERMAVAQVAPGDQLALRVRRQPRAAMVQQLIRLTGVDVVVLGVVEHRQQDIEVTEDGLHGLRA